MSNLLDREQNGIFSSEVAQLEITVWRKRLFQSAITTLSIGLPLTAILVPNQTVEQKIKELGMGVILGSASALIGKLREKDEKKYTTFNNLNAEHFKGTVKSVFDYERNIQFMKNRMILADKISTFSEGAQLKFGKDFQVSELITRAIPYDDVDIEAEVVQEISISPQTLQLEQQKQAVEIKTKIDLSWLDSEFIAGSKVVVGGRGSGKSHYLKYEAARYYLGCQITNLAHSFVDLNDDFQYRSNGNGRCRIFIELSASKLNDTFHKLDSSFVDFDELSDSQKANYEEIKKEYLESGSLEYWKKRIKNWDTELTCIGKVPKNLYY